MATKPSPTTYLDAFLTQFRHLTTIGLSRFLTFFELLKNRNSELFVLKPRKKRDFRHFRDKINIDAKIMRLANFHSAKLGRISQNERIIEFGIWSSFWDKRHSTIRTHDIRCNFIHLLFRIFSDKTSNNYVIFSETLKSWSSQFSFLFVFSGMKIEEYH